MTMLSRKKLWRANKAKGIPDTSMVWNVCGFKERYLAILQQAVVSISNV